MTHDSDVEQDRKVIRIKFLFHGSVDVLFPGHFGTLFATHVQRSGLTRIAEFEIKEVVLALVHLL
jgi:hypothetical protein